jgi:hypothetical protein
MLLKIIALVSMLIDHAGVLLFDDPYIMRLIGRLAFPLFAWFLVLGMQRSTNKNRYIRDLFFLALISQPIYIISGIDQIYKLNILFELLAAAATIRALQINMFTFKKIYTAITIVISIFISHFSEYGTAGYALILSLYMLHKNSDLAYLNIWNGREYRIGSLFLVLVVLALLVNIQIVFWPVIPIFFFLIYSKIDYVIPYHKRFKYFFYLFYPLHLIALHVISL